MKKLIKKLPVIAFVLAAMAAFAFTTPAEDSMEVWFDVATNGDIGDEISGSQHCTGTLDYCAVSFLEEDLDEFGNPPITNVTQDPNEEYIVQLDKKN